MSNITLTPELAPKLIQRYSQEHAEVSMANFLMDIIIKEHAAKEEAYIRRIQELENDNRAVNDKLSVMQEELDNAKKKINTQLPTSIHRDIDLNFKGISSVARTDILPHNCLSATSIGASALPLTGTIVHIDENHWKKMKDEGLLNDTYTDTDHKISIADELLP